MTPSSKKGDPTSAARLDPSSRANFCLSWYGLQRFMRFLKFFGIMCLEFYYYMSGAVNGSLHVSINETVVFSASGDKGDIRHKASINISSIVGLHWVSINVGKVVSSGRQATLLPGTRFFSE